jgi:hypothetical protein
MRVVSDTRLTREDAMSLHVRTTTLFVLAHWLLASVATAQGGNSLQGIMVSGGSATLRAGGDGVWYPQFHLTATGRSGWGVDGGIGVYSGDGSGILVDVAAAHVSASRQSAVGFMVMFGPTAIVGEGGAAIGATVGGALLVRVAPHIGLRIDASPKLYVSGYGADPAIVFSLSLTSLPGGWNGK